MFTETSLGDDITDQELLLNNYNIYRCDRSEIRTNKTRGGGVLIAVDKKICSSSLIIDATDFEQLFIKIKINGVSILLSAVYFPPTSPLTRYQHHVETVNSLLSTYCFENFLFLGDYNFPGYEWDYVNSSSKIIGFHLNKVIRDSINFINTSYNSLKVKQINKIKNCCNNILDLIFLSNFFKYDINKCIDPLLNVDIFHDPIEFVIFYEENIDFKYFFETYNFSKADYNLLNFELTNVNWQLVFDNHNDVNIILDKFIEILFIIIKKYVPIKKSKRPLFPNWFSVGLRDAIILKKKLHKNYKCYKNDYNYDRFDNQRSITEKLLNIDYKIYLNDVENSVKTDSKKFYKFVNNGKECNSYPSVMEYNSVKTDDFNVIVNLFSELFGSVYKNQNLNDFNIDDISNKNIGSLVITETDVDCAIKSLKAEGSPGPDGIHPFFVKSCALSLIKPLLIIYNKSLATGTFPSSWNQSYITPIFKSGDKSKIENYRPVTISCCFERMFDNIIINKISSHIYTYIVPEQHGFYPKRSVVTNLSVIVEEIVEALNDGLELHAVYMDMSKAFDRVNIDLLLKKLLGFGICGNLLEWFSSYLHGRTQRVRIKNFISNLINVTSGVPQGSHLGPLLFLVYINDIKRYIFHCKFLLYADDLKLFLKIRNYLDLVKIQVDINNVFKYCKLNGLDINIIKSFFMIYAKYQVSSQVYSINNMPLEKKETLSDLGVIFSYNLNFDAHLDNVIAKAFKRVYFILRKCKGFTDPQSMVALFNSMVKPILNYASVIWCPHTKTDIKKIESVQRYFMRCVSYKTPVPMRFDQHDYSVISNLLNMPNLNSIRKYNDLMFMYKLFNNLIDCPDILQKVSLRIPGRRLRNVVDMFILNKAHLNYENKSIVARLSILSNQNQHWIDYFNMPISTFKSLAKSSLLEY